MSTNNSARRRKYRARLWSTFGAVTNLIPKREIKIHMHLRINTYTFARACVCVYVRKRTEYIFYQLCMYDTNIINSQQLYFQAKKKQFNSFRMYTKTCKHHRMVEAVWHYIVNNDNCKMFKCPWSAFVFIYLRVFVALDSLRYTCV